MNQDLEYIVFHYILRSVDLTDKTKAEFFSISYIRELFKILKPYIMQYQTLPSADQVIKILAISDIPQEIKDYLNADVIYQLWKVQENLGNYDEEWLSNTTRAFISWQTLMYGLRNSMTYIKSVQSDVNIENYQEIVDRARSMFTKNTGVDFNNTSKGADIYDAEAHKTKDLKKYSTGYPFVDRASKGGYWAGSLWVFLGAPKAGKSRLLQNLCAQSIRKGDNCAYCSFELQEEIIIQRIGSNLFNISIDHYDDYANDSNIMRQKIQEFRTSNLKSPGTLDVKSFPTSATSINDIEAWLLKEEERISQETGVEFHFKNIFLDYINIMKNWRNPNSENTYMKIKQIAEDARAMAMKNHWCVITVSQVKQAFFNAGDMDMSAASESSALGATVDMMFGIITDVMLQAEHALYLKTILSRVSPFVNERKKFLIDEDHMRLDEDRNAKIIRDEEINENFMEKSKKIVQNYHQQLNQLSNGNSGIVVNPSQSTVIKPQLGLTEVTGQGLFE